MAQDDAIAALATAVVDGLIARRLTVATAESCTGGWIAKAITDVAGSSACFGYGVVSYSNAAKTRLLNVGAQTLADSGAVSEATVREMAEGVLELSAANVAVAVSGIAGPEGGSDEKPVGTVWLAWSVADAGKASTDTELHHFSGDRATVRALTVRVALEGIRRRMESASGREHAQRI